MPASVNGSRDEATVTRGREATKHDLVQIGDRADDMIGRLNQHDRVGLLLDKPQRGRSQSRPGVARFRFEKDLTGLDADLTELIGDHKAVILVAGDDRRREPGIGEITQYRLLKHRPVGDERKKLLR